MGLFDIFKKKTNNIIDKEYYESDLKFKDINIQIRI